MMIFARKFILMSLLGAVLVLAGCETVEEKAESKYQNAVQLQDDGDVDRALVELRGVFNLNGEHRDARMMYADILVDQAKYEEAFGHYLLAAQTYPDYFPARLKLARLAIDLGAWDAAEEHADVAAELQPGNPEIRPILASVAYRDAAQGADTAGMEAAFEDAQAILKDEPGNELARQIMLDKLIRDGRIAEALEALEIALEQAPMNRQFNQMKLSLLARSEDMAGLGAHLRDMVERFPENREIRTALVRWYLANDDPEGAEAFVRRLVERSGDEIPPRLALVQFLNQVQGSKRAIEQVEAFIEEGLDDSTFRLLKASLLFDAGERETAISQVETLLEGKESSDDVRDMQTTLARMLLANEQTERAQKIVTEVLEEDPENQNALKLQANWLIEEDKVRDAVLALRTALDQQPDDPETITLLARAYERGGNRELMTESLALAVEASNAAPAESLRYARLLIAEERYRAAEDVLLQSLRLSPTNVDLLRRLAEVYLAMNDVSRAEQAAQALSDLGTEEAKGVANSVQAAILQRTARTDESIELMQNMIREGQSELVAQTAIIRTRLANGEIAEARRFMDELLAQTPEGNPNRNGVMFLNAALTATEGDFEAARTIYRDILARNPKIEPVWRALAATAVREGDIDRAVALVDEGLQELPGSANLRWIKAGLAERQGRIDEAIEIYEALYADDSSSTIIANNLASMITTYRDDEESLQRAFLIARRLRGSDFPAFQDTYGWISYRLGNYEDALDNLVPAAEGLPNDPTVQYHLARLYEALGRNEEAIEYYDIALELWEGSRVPLVAKARAERDVLAQRMAEGTATEPTVPDDVVQ